MEENIELVDGTTENTVEQTAEEIVEPQKIYTEEELNQKIDSILPKKLNRREEKIRREYENKYGELENILLSGLNVSSLEEATENLREFYSQKGVVIQPKTSSLNERDTKTLAERDANEIIESSSLGEIKEELDNLAGKGIDNMTSRDKVMFQKLNDYYKNESARKELASAGITEDALKDADFINFANKLNPNMSLKDKYEMYNEYRPKPMVEPIGSMKGTKTVESGVKEFYTREEALQFTREDFDKNPELFKAVEKSMLKW